VPIAKLDKNNQPYQLLTILKDNESSPNAANILEGNEEYSPLAAAIVWTFHRRIRKERPLPKRTRRLPTMNNIIQKHGQYP